nr:MAG TPA: hypothetical protein [Caudoviricetes sp.]
MVYIFNHRITYKLKLFCCLEKSWSKDHDFFCYKGKVSVIHFLDITIHICYRLDGTVEFAT